MSDLVAKTIWDTVRSRLHPYRRQEMAAEIVDALQEGDLPTVLLGDAGKLLGEPTSKEMCSNCGKPSSWRGMRGMYDNVPVFSCMKCVSFIEAPELI